MPRYVITTLHMMTVFSDGAIPQKAVIRARRTIVVVMPNLFCREFKEMWFSQILHPRQVVSLLSTQLTRYVVCAPLRALGRRFLRLVRCKTGRRLCGTGARLGVDVTAIEGRLAATAYALVQEGISSGGYPVLPKNPEFARIGAEAAGLYELMNPGTILETGVGGDPAKQRALQDFIEAAGEAFARGDLRLQDGELAQGWVETFPEPTI